MRIIALLISLSLFSSLSAQHSDRTAARIIEQIPMSEDTVQSVFTWVAQYLIYDTRFPASRKKYSKPKELIDYALRERSGICQHYAELFHLLMTELNYPSYVISGYSNNTPGNSHAWNAVKIDQQWYLFDPTFASGGITSSGQFIKDYDPQWYKVKPDNFIRTHIPYDYVWQFKSDPISHQSFDKNSFDETIFSDFNYESYINTYTRLDDKVWCDAALARMNSQPYRNPLISKYISYLNSVSYGLEINEKVDAHNVEIDKLNRAVELFNTSVTDFNNYIIAKNRRFRMEGYSKNQLMPKMEQIHSAVSEAMRIFSSISTHNDETMKVVNENIMLGREFLNNIGIEKEFIRTQLR